MVIKVIPIIKNPKFIVVAKFTKGITHTWDIYYHYHFDSYKANTNCDIGVWRIHYKEKATLI